VQTGSEAISDTDALADEEFHKEGKLYRGTVRMHGELWSAISATPIAANQRLGIESRDGLTLRVKSISEPAPLLTIGKDHRRNIA
jgi:membrane-bound ClpP family serine protease